MPFCTLVVQSLEHNLPPPNTADRYRLEYDTHVLLRETDK